MTDIDDRPHLQVVRPGGSGRFTPPPPFANKGFVASAVVLIVIVALAGWLIFGRSSSHHQAAVTKRAPHGAKPPATVTSLPKAATSACHVPPGSQQVPKVAPSGVTWDLFDGVAVPFSKTAGPQVVSGDVARCYAHSPTGGLLADLQIGARYLLSPSWRTVVADQVAPGPGVAKYSALRAKATSSNAPGQFCQAAGFAVLSYTPAAEELSTVSHCPNGALQAVTEVVRWDGTDWRLVLTPAGGPASSATQLGNLTGYVPFGGV